MSAGLLGSLTLIYGAITVLMLIGSISIVRKAGYSGWWVLTGFVPLLNVVMFLVFAFSEWPARLGPSSPATSSAHAAAVHAGQDPRFTYPAA
jgi:hypothetical protein